MGLPHIDELYYAADWRATCPNPVCGRHIAPSDIECPNCKGRGMRFYRSWDTQGRPGGIGELNYGFECDNCGISQCPLPCPSECGSVVTNRLVTAYMKITSADMRAIDLDLVIRHPSKESSTENLLIKYQFSITVLVSLVVAAIAAACTLLYLRRNGPMRDPDGPRMIAFAVFGIIVLVVFSLVNRAYEEYNERSYANARNYPTEWAWLTFKS